MQTYLQSIVYSNQEVFDRVLDLLPKYPKICCVVAYDCTTDSSPVPLLVHMTAPGPAPKSTKDSITSHIYAGARPLFYEPHLETYKAGPATLSYTRTVEFLRKHLGGPYFDLEAIWDEHCLYEFEQRSLAKTMGTMVVSVQDFCQTVCGGSISVFHCQEEPYVNHIPTVSLIIEWTGLPLTLASDDWRNRTREPHCVLSRPLHLQVRMTIVHQPTMGILTVAQESG
jgi:carboxymethylenebutenolidase